MAERRFPPPWSVEELDARARHPGQLDTPPFERQRNDAVSTLGLAPPVLETGFANDLPELEAASFPGVVAPTTSWMGPRP